MFKRGKHVGVVLGAGEEVLVGHFLKDNGDKCSVQVGDKVYNLALREKADWENKDGDGLTFHTL